MSMLIANIASAFTFLAIGSFDLLCQASLNVQALYETKEVLMTLQDIMKEHRVLTSL
jgi:hypothetical protein